MIATILDTKTGEILRVAGPRCEEWASNNYSCDCNRNIYGEDLGTSKDFCAGSKRFLVVRAETNLPDDEIEKYSIEDFNEDYPDELKAKFLPLSMAMLAYLQLRQTFKEQLPPSEVTEFNERRELRWRALTDRDKDLVRGLHNIPARIDLPKAREPEIKKVPRASRKPTYRPRKPAQWCRAVKLCRWTFELSNHINSECVDFGVCINWNFRPSLEISFLFWRLYIEYGKKK